MSDTQAHLEPLEKPKFPAANIGENDVADLPDRTEQQTNDSPSTTDEDSSGTNDNGITSKRTSVDSFDRMNNSFETIDESVNSHTETDIDCDDQSNKSIYNTPTKPNKDVKTDVDITEEFNSIIRQSPRKNKNHSLTFPHVPGAC